MPKRYGTRLAKIQRHSGNRSGMRRTTHNAVINRIDLGPSRRDPQGTLSSRFTQSQATHEKKQNALQRASAKGSVAVTRRVSPTRQRERQPSSLNARSTSLDFGVRVSSRAAHANRAYAKSFAHASNHQRGLVSR
jgi:hypothetical protein